MKISYLTAYDASDIHNWSGTGYYIAKALRDQNAEIDFVGNLQAVPDPVSKIKQRLYRRFGRTFEFERTRHYAKQIANLAMPRIRPDADIVFSPGSLWINFLETKKPKVFCTDATFAGMIGFYETFSTLCRETMRSGNQIEQLALQTCSMAFYASDWAARTAVENYKVDPEKIKVVPFGANIECHRTLEDIKKIVDRRPEKECRLLFLGVDWKRKGGDVAVQVTEKLNRDGLKTTLHVAGIKQIPLSPLPPFIVDHGFIAKSLQTGTERIEKLFAESHFLLVPSVAEAYGLVFCEANSFGLPAIATNVGGIPTIIKDGVNGRTFPLSSTAGEYANYIRKTFDDHSAYRELCFSSFNEYEKRLNWKVAGKTMMDFLLTL
jgi:glycosyltransferase involved in cell wall biosynthesis